MSSADGNTLAVFNGTIYLSKPPPTQPFTLAVATIASNGVPTFNLTGQAGYSYFVQASSDLINWATIANLMNTNGTVPFTDPAGTNYAQRFYRIVVP